MEGSRRGFETCLKLLQAGDADGLRQFCNKIPPTPRPATRPA